MSTKTIRNAAGQESAVRTFHADGALEFRLSVLAFNKCVHFHVFDLAPEQLQEISLLDLLDLAEDQHNADASKLEIGTGNFGDFDFATVKDLKEKLREKNTRVEELLAEVGKLQADNAQIAEIKKKRSAPATQAVTEAATEKPPQS